MLKKIFTVVIAAQAILFSTGISASPFDKGRSTIAISAGNGSAFNDNYLILGLGYGYYLANGLQLGIDFDFWLNGSPSVYQVTPEIQYVFHQSHYHNILHFYFGNIHPQFYHEKQKYNLFFSGVKVFD